MARTGKSVSRRAFVRGSAVSLAALGVAGSRLFAAGSDTIRVGLIGCGSRGMGAVRNCVDSSPNVEIVSLGDLPVAPVAVPGKTPLI